MSLKKNQLNKLLLHIINPIQKIEMRNLKIRKSIKYQKVSNLNIIKLKIPLIKVNRTLFLLKKYLVNFQINLQRKMMVKKQNQQRLLMNFNAHIVVKVLMEIVNIIISQLLHLPMVILINIILFMFLILINNQTIQRNRIQ